MQTSSPMAVALIDHNYGPKELSFTLLYYIWWRVVYAVSDMFERLRS